MWITLGVVGGFLALVIVFDLVQTRHAILRNFPVIGHFRYLLEAVGPELRQYIVTGNDEELPFSRDQRRWVYASSKRQNNYFGFGTDNDIERSPNYLIIKQATFPLSSPTKSDPATTRNMRCRAPRSSVVGAVASTRFDRSPSSTSRR